MSTKCHSCNEYLDSNLFYDRTDSRCMDCKKGWVALGRLADQYGMKKRMLQWKRENPNLAQQLVIAWREWTGQLKLGRKRKRGRGQSHFDIESWLSRKQDIVVGASNAQD